VLSLRSVSELEYNAQADLKGSHPLCCFVDYAGGKAEGCTAALFIARNMPYFIWSISDRCH